MKPSNRPPPPGLEDRDIPTGAAALAKGLHLMEVIGDFETPPRFRDLQARTGLSKGTLARMLNTLVSFRLIRHEDSDSTYRLGHRLFELAHRVWEGFDLRDAAAPVLDRLADEKSETVAICTLDGEAVLYTDQRSRGGAFGFRIEVGRRAPLYCTAGGKVLLAFAAPHEQRALLDRITLVAHAPATITDREALLAELAITRARGYAISVSEHIPGVCSVAAPIFDHTGKAIAAIGVFGPASRLPGEMLHTTGRDLMAAGRQISGNAGAAPMNINSRAPGEGEADPSAECVLPWGAHLAEGPLWMPESGQLHWVDILAPSVHRFDPETRQNREVILPGMVSALAPRASGGLVALTQSGLAGFDFDSGALTPLVDPEAAIPDNRFNDGRCDRKGRLWAGTMALDAMRPSGSLYRIDPDLTWQRMETGFSVANGLDWSPDDRSFYFVDSAPGRIHVWDFDLATGSIDNRRLFAEIPATEGRPDGLAVDSEGHVWCAIWDGWCLRRYDPSGRVSGEIRLPVPRPTSIAFGGPDLKTLFVTTARVRLPSRLLAEAPFSGGIFAVPVEVAGLPATPFAG